MAGSNQDDFFQELHDLLGRLSPMRRKSALAELTESERLGLEAWMLAGRSRKGFGAELAAKTWRSAATASDGRSSVVNFSQRSLTGKATHWYYAVVCLPGLHIIARMRRSRCVAVGDSKVLAAAKRSVMEAAQAGRSFEEARLG
ncbi:unnamed protein product, partial [Effrenium voratum]